MNKVVVIEDETIIRNGIINMIRNHIQDFRVVGEAIMEKKALRSLNR